MKEKKVGFIYLLTNLVNGKKYVGQTKAKSVWHRWRQHIAKARFGRGGPLCSAIRKYGEKGFSVETLLMGDASKLNAREVDFVKLHNSLIDNKHGYNVTNGGDTAFEMAKIAKRKISKAAVAQWKNPEIRNKMVVAVSKAGLKRYEDPAQRKARSESNKLVWLRPGYRAKQESRSPESRQKMSSFNNSRWANPAYRATHGVASKATKLKMSKSQLKAWADPVRQATAAAKSKKLAERQRSEKEARRLANAKTAK